MVPSAESSSIVAQPVFVTHANSLRILQKVNIKDLNLMGEVYKIQIAFFSKYEENELLGIQEILKDLETFLRTYKAVRIEDTLTFVYEGRSPAYHKFRCCPKLHAAYENFIIPKEIRDKGAETISEYRTWFEGVRHLLEEKSDAFAMRHQLKWGQKSNLLVVNHSNSGEAEEENISIEALDYRIMQRLKEAGNFFARDMDTSIILQRHSKRTFQLDRTGEFGDRDYTDAQIVAVLREYNTRFKQPVRKDLIKLYRMTLNPDLKMAEDLLSQLGFKACSICHAANYAPQPLQVENA